MAKVNSLKEETQTEPRQPLRIAVLVIALIGLIVASYLTYIKFAPGALLCKGVGDCEAVNASPYSWLLGIPIAVFGALAYLAIIATVILEPRNSFFAQWGVTIEFALGLIGMLYSAYLTYIELFVIYKICPYCVTSAVAITLICILSGIRLFRQME